MSLQVVVYAEGARETGRWAAAPGSPLTEDELGAAHVLVRRAVAHVSRVPEAAVRFVGPLRDRRGRPLVGSALWDATRIGHLLRLHDAGAPAVHLVVLLVDEDTSPRRRADLLAAVAGFTTPSVVGVARKEFEAWLMADPRGVRSVLPEVVEVPANPEALAPRQAKALLGQWCTGRDEPETRAALARSLDLGVARGSLSTFLRSLGEALADGASR